MSENVAEILEGASGVDVLAKLVDFVRPKRGRQHAEARLEAVLSHLGTNPSECSKLRSVLKTFWVDVSASHALATSGIMSDAGVARQLRSRMGARVLPKVYGPRDLRTLLPRIFKKRNDWRWVRELPVSQLSQVIGLLAPEGHAQRASSQVDNALTLLALRIAGLGTDEEIHHKLDQGDARSPFLKLPLELGRFLDERLEGDSKASFADTVATVEACREHINEVRENNKTYGTSLRLTGATRRLLQKLHRFELLLHVAQPQDSQDFGSSVAKLMVEVLEAEQTKNSLVEVVTDNVDLLAYQVTEHTADKGESYFAGTRSAYFRGLLAAMGGGAIVAVFAIVKLLLGHLEMPLALQAFVYGLNYSACFVCIYFTGAVLATKQPAMTASAIARRIDQASSDTKALESVADSIVLVWRSQFVSFLGNLLMAVPMAMLIGYGLEQILGTVVIDDTKAAYLLKGNHPTESLALFYAGIAGVMLFLSGVIQGAVSNQVVYSGLHARLLAHPRLQFLGAKKTGLVDFITKNLSGIVGNVFLGFMLGAAGVFGVIFGIPFDIRHIAFSSAHVGAALLDAPHLVNIEMTLALALGVLAIGLVNFLLSFGLTLAVTLKSRKVSFVQGGALVVLLVKKIIQHPLHWFLPMPKPDPSKSV